MKSKKREIIEWAILIGVAATLYLTGLHTEVIGQIQRVVLATGIISPDVDSDSQVDAAYNMMLEDLNGNRVPFSTFKDHTIFLNFWATWCPPCIAEMPDIHHLYEKVGNQTQFVMISLDKDRERARAFIQKKGYRFPVYFLASSLPAVYDPHAIPTTYVISPYQKIVLTNHGMAKYDTKEFRKFLLNL